MRAQEKVWFCMTKDGKIVSHPYWNKRDVIIHMEEIEYPADWKQLRKMGYVIEYRMIYNLFQIPPVKKKSK